MGIRWSSELLSPPLGGGNAPRSGGGGGLRQQVLQVYQPPASGPIRGHRGRAPSPSRVGPGEGLLQVGETESEGDARCWLWWKGHARESPSAQVSRQKSEKQSRESPAYPGRPRTGRSGVAWRRGLRFFTEEASGGLASGRGRRGTAPVRRRTPPACWASGRLHRWLVWAPPRSSCPRPSSSSGTA